MVPHLPENKCHRMTPDQYNYVPGDTLYTKIFHIFHLNELVQCSKNLNTGRILGCLLNTIVKLLRTLSIYLISSQVPSTPQLNKLDHFGQTTDPSVLTWSIHVNSHKNNDYYFYEIPLSQKQYKEV